MRCTLRASPAVDGSPGVGPAWTGRSGPAAFAGGKLGSAACPPNAGPAGGRPPASGRTVRSGTTDPGRKPAPERVPSAPAYGPRRERLAGALAGTDGAGKFQSPASGFQLPAPKAKGVTSGPPAALVLRRYQRPAGSKTPIVVRPSPFQSPTMGVQPG